MGHKAIFDRAEMVQRYISGESLKSLERSLKAHRYTLCRALLKAGVTPRSQPNAATLENSRRRWRDVDEPAFVADYEAGTTLRDAARKIGIGRPRASRILEDYGVAVRTNQASRRITLRNSPARTNLAAMAKAREGYLKWLEAGGIRAANGQGKRTLRLKRLAAAEQAVAVVR